MEHHPIAAKVAIPRNPKADPPQPVPKKARTQRACENCRKRKVRCTGESHCRNCLDQGLSCSYSLGRRDRLNEATEQNSRLIGLLRDLNLHVDDEGRKLIHQYLDTPGNDEQTLASPSISYASPYSAKRSREGSPEPEENRHDGPQQVRPSEKDNEKHFDVLGENVLQTFKSRATGYVGVNSSIQWLRSLRAQMKNLQIASNDDESSRNPDINTQNARHRNSQRLNTIRVSDSTFYLDCDDPELDDLFADPLDVPPPDILDGLFDSYMQTTHPSFPILPDVFQDQFRRYSTSLKEKRADQVSDEWLAMLNLVLAIGRQYSHLTSSDSESPGHLIYIARATRLLRLDKIATSLPSPTLLFIQSIGLLSLSYLVIGQLSRAWMMIGIALRFALAAGLHLRNDDPSTPSAQNETMINTWWSLQVIESLLCSIIGRPCVIPDQECTVPLPRALGASPPRPNSSTGRMSKSSRDGSDTVTSASFLGAWVTIALLTQEALSKLYSPRATTDSWHIIQGDITSLMRRLDRWAVNSRLAGTSTMTTPTEETHRNKQLLAFQYQSAKILITRPCLCRLQGYKELNEELSELKKGAAASCVSAALAMAQLLPDDPHNLQAAYFQIPWWSIIHNIMQAVAVLLLKMSFGPLHTVHEGQHIVTSVQKLVKWLEILKSTSQVAGRALNIVANIMHTSGARSYFNFAFPSDASIPTPDVTARSTSQTPASTPEHSQENAYAYPPQQMEPVSVCGEYTPSQGDFADFRSPTNPKGSPYLGTNTMPQSHMPQNNLLPLYYGHPFYTYFDYSNALIEDPSTKVNAFTNIGSFN
ncbi:unnamed protein product [Periconia digitata]|uniref:Zn(2)-C6 fungal-type domain-containing protein n=1 Tax=Periconia digitata TaxID=1303443 RepID=A0A9W4UR40_9PLEO|nr:unnamed protein product [Periconia digitata]